MQLPQDLKKDWEKRSMNRKRGKWGVYVEKKIGGLCIQ